jgi:DNA-directed RNA polymerase subunit RPC12/RpoP
VEDGKEEMIGCHFCGSKIGVGAFYCTHCGREVHSNNTEQQLEKLRRMHHGN